METITCIPYPPSLMALCIQVQTAKSKKEVRKRKKKYVKSGAGNEGAGLLAQHGRAAFMCSAELEVPL